jgi:hypothetical protein
LLMLLQFRIKCSMFSSSFALSKHFGSISFLYILIRLLCRMYVPVSSSFNFIGNLAASTAQWQLILNRGWIIPVFRFSTVRKLSPLNNGSSCIIEPLQWLYTVFLTIAVHMVFLTGLSRYHLASLRSYFRSMCLIAMNQLALSLFFFSSWRLASDFAMLLSSWLQMLLNRPNARICSWASIGSIQQVGNDSICLRIFFWKFSRSNRELVVGSISSNP